MDEPAEHVASWDTTRGVNENLHRREPREEDFLRLNDQMDSVTAGIQANSAEDFFDALLVTEAAEVEADQRNVLDCAYPPLAPQLAASPEQTETTAASEALINFGDDEASSSQIPGHDNTPQGSRWQLFTDSHLLPPASPASTGRDPRRAEVEEPDQKQVEQYHPSTDQESPNGESRQLVAPAQDAETKTAEEEPLDEHHAQSEFGRCYKRNRKTKEKLRRRRAERAQREAESRMLDNDAGVDPSTIRNEGVSQPVVQAAEMPTPAHPVAEHPAFTNIHPEPPLVDAGLDDSLQERAGPSEAIEATGQTPARRRRGQGARRRRQQRELHYGTPQVMGDRTSLQDDEAAGEETAEGSKRNGIDVPEAQQSDISPIPEQTAEPGQDIQQDGHADDERHLRPFIERFQDPAPSAAEAVSPAEGVAREVGPTQQAPADEVPLTRQQRQNRRSNRYRSENRKAARRGQAGGDGSKNR
ncbi:MAG: hypothetical protein Q9207_004577 [Kuettlingeria erythrocarpa]